MKLAMTRVSIENSSGDLMAITKRDAFDVGSSTGVTVSGANVKNQDDCLAINLELYACLLELCAVSSITANHDFFGILHSLEKLATVVTALVLDPLVAETVILWRTS